MQFQDEALGDGQAPHQRVALPGGGDVSLHLGDIFAGRGGFARLGLEDVREGGLGAFNARTRNCLSGQVGAQQQLGVPDERSQTLESSQRCVGIRERLDRPAIDGQGSGDGAWLVVPERPPIPRLERGLLFGKRREDKYASE